jgi:predicted DsbA family dithiol-disulfide isomerase
MSDDTKKNNLPKIIGAIAVVAVLIGGVIFVRGMLTGGDSFEPTANLIRPWNPIAGNKNSSVKLVYLYDYQCPACQSNAENMTTLKAEFGDKLAIVYKPFIVHPGSGNRMAQAAASANKQDKFNEFSEKLIRQTPGKTNGLSIPELETLATQVGLDKAKFTKEYNSKEVEDNIAIDQKDIKDVILPVSKYSEDKNANKPGSTPTLVLLKDNKFTDSWWSGVLSLDDAKKGEENVKGVRTRINELLK